MPDRVAVSPFHIEHIIPIKHHGKSEPDNLAWACLQCNLSKGSDLAAYDAVTGALTPFFNPRQESWNDHFEMKSAVIVGKTPIGRVTVETLHMNSREQVAIREAVIESSGWSD